MAGMVGRGVFPTEISTYRHTDTEKEIVTFSVNGTKTWVQNLHLNISIKAGYKPNERKEIK